LYSRLPAQLLLQCRRQSLVPPLEADYMWNVAVIPKVRGLKV
jgi:hypothetical protein